MKGVDSAGREIKSRREAGGIDKNVLGALDVPTLRRFVIDLLRRGGVSRDKIVKVMRTNRSQSYRDALPEQTTGAGVTSD